MTTKRKRSQLLLATTDDGIRAELWKAEADKAGLSVAQWALQILDASLPKPTQRKLPPLLKRGERG